MEKRRLLREQFTQRRSETDRTITPLESLDLITERMRQYRQRVDHTERQPFLAGAELPSDLRQQTKTLQEQWGGLSEAIRAGRPPATIPAETLRRLSLPTTATGAVPVTGNIWSGISNDYFAETARLERLAEQRAAPFRESVAMRKLVSEMKDAETRLRAIEATVDPESEPHRRDLTWRLLGIWRLLVELQLHRYDQQLKAEAGDPALNQFLMAADAARALRHPGLSLTAGGGAPVATDAPPLLLVPMAAGATIRAQLGDVDSTVIVNPEAPSQLAVLAAELYHVHYLLANVDELGREPERRQTYEGRRLAVLGEIVREANRILKSGG